MNLNDKINMDISNIDIMYEKTDKSNDKLVGIISLGCDKNRVDTEIMLTYLKEGGYNFTGDAENADIIIINTCGFIKTAREEALDTIYEMCEYRVNAEYKCQRLIVTGCMPQKWSSDIIEEFPEVDIILGIDHYKEIVSIIDKSFETKKKILMVGNADSTYYVKNKLVTTPQNYAYLKVADGCDNFCTFCTIPHIRGRYRSRDFDEIILEANDLVNGGATELILVAQDISRYGIEKYGKTRIIELIRKLSEIENLKWIRLLYCYPEMITNELLDEMMNNPKLCKYLDVPLQHISDNVLKKMNRKSSRNDIENIIKNIKNLPKYVAVRTTMMTGFPGETEEDFNELCKFIEESKLMHIGFFAYSKEDGTPAGNMPNQVDDKIKQKRLLKLMSIQKKIAREVNSSLIGQVVEVCYEGIDFDKQLFYGRCEYQSPDVDSIVFFKSKVPLEIGNYYKVKIKSITGCDLKGEIIYE